MRTAPPHAPLAIVVLGCVVRLDGEGRLQPGALARRLEVAALLYSRRTGAIPSELSLIASDPSLRPGCGRPLRSSVRTADRVVVIASGGRHWGGLVEADVMARELVWRGVPHATIVRERCSLTTRDNARFAAAALERRGIRSAVVVTSEWHLPRAMAHFREAGVCVQGVGAPEASGAPRRRDVFRRYKERLLLWFQTDSKLAAMVRESGGGAHGNVERLERSSGGHHGSERWNRRGPRP